MKKRDYFLEFLAALIVFSITSLWVHSPGYMDAEYYTLSAIQMTEGRGMTQPVLWNYLDDPAGLPHPSHTYWMPAPSLTATLGMALLGHADFNGGRWIFLLIAALAAPAAGWMGFRFSRNRWIGWLAAGLAIFCGYYLPYTSTVDSFFLIMPAAWMIFYGLDRVLTDKNASVYLWLCMGLASGWMHLNRADGFLWLALPAIILLYRLFRRRERRGKAAAELSALLVGYIGVMGFWYLRNLAQYGNLSVPNTMRTLWVNRYDEIFSYPAGQLTFSHWMSAGWSQIITDRLGAAGYNLVIMLAVQGLIFLFPFWLSAAWKRRQDPLVRIGMGMELVYLLVMSFVFPYSGKQGGFLHSTAALQPFVWGLAAAGILDGLSRLVKRGALDLQKAIRVFVPGILFISLIVSAFVFRMLVIGEDPSKPAWEESARRAAVSAELLERNQISPSTRIMINNPVGFWLASRHEAIVIPNGTPEVSLAAARAYGAEYMILEKHLVTGLFDLYKQPEKYPGFNLIDKQEDQMLFKIDRTQGL